MPRPPKPRTVKATFDVSYFKPRGVPMRDLEEVSLGVEEVEALRLADVEGMTQAELGEKMGVSRATAGRVLESAHRKVAEALTQGKALLIEGGNYKVKRRGGGAGPGRGNLGRGGPGRAGRGQSGSGRGQGGRQAGGRGMGGGGRGNEQA